MVDSEEYQVLICSQQRLLQHHWALHQHQLPIQVYHSSPPSLFLFFILSSYLMPLASPSLSLSFLLLHIAYSYCMKDSCALYSEVVCTKASGDMHTHEQYSCLCYPGNSFHPRLFPATLSIFTFYFIPPLSYFFHILYLWYSQVTFDAEGSQIHSFLYQCQQCHSLSSTKPHHQPSLSPHLTRLAFTDYTPFVHRQFSTTHKPNRLPPHFPYLKHMEFTSTVGSLPNGLTYLSFGPYFDQPVDHLPPFLRQLQFGKYFNQPVDHLPSSLTKLTFDSKDGVFNHPLNALPPHLLDITLAYKFNHPIDSLPSSLTSLDLSTKFTRSVNKLPPLLTKLHIHNAYRIPIHSDVNLRIPSWPSSLATLTLNNFAREGYQNLPSTITSLSISPWCYPSRGHELPAKFLPPSLTNLVLQGVPCHINNWDAFAALESLSTDELEPSCTYPHTLTKLTINSCYIGRDQLAELLHSIDHVNYDISLDNLPPNLSHLSIRNCQFNKLVDNLPPTLTHLSITADIFNQPLDQLPPLFDLTLVCSKFKHPVDNLPSSLLRLTLDCPQFNHPVDHLPSSLLHLTLDCPRLNYPINHLPPSLVRLSLGDHYSCPLQHLPSSLTDLRLGAAFSESLNHLPMSLAILKLNYNHLKARGVSFDSLPPFVSVIHEQPVTKWTSVSSP